MLEVGMMVRNIKTRTVGELVNIKLAEPGKHGLGKVRYEDGLEVEYRLADLEELNRVEYELVKKLIEARAAKKEAADLSKAADSVAAKAEDDVVEYLRKNSLESTKAYEGLGLAAIDGMKVMPTITEENREAAFAAIRALGRGEIIKETIHPSTLAGLVTELLDEGKVPESIGYYLKPKLSVRKK